MQSTSIPWLWFPVIGSRSSGYMTTYERVYLRLLGTTPVGPEYCIHLRALESDVRGPDRHLLSSWRCCVRWLWGDVVLLSCDVPISKLFLTVCRRDCQISFIVGRGWCLLFWSHITWGILPRDNCLSGSLMSLWVVFVRLSKWPIFSGIWLHSLSLLLVPYSPPSGGFLC